MKLSPNVGSDRSWVWNAAADVSEGEPEAVTLAIRFANTEGTFPCDFQAQISVMRKILTSFQGPTSSRMPLSRPKKTTKLFLQSPRRLRRKIRRRRLERSTRKKWKAGP
jgi:hypothetical protein